MPRVKKPDPVDSRFAETESRLNALEGRSQDHSWTVILGLCLLALTLKVFFWPTQSSASANAINVHRHDIDRLQSQVNRLDAYTDRQNEWLYRFDDRVKQLEYKTGLVPTPAPTPVPKTPCSPCTYYYSQYYSNGVLYPNWVTCTTTCR